MEEEKKLTLPQNVHLSVDFESLSEEEKRILLDWLEKLKTE